METESEGMKLKETVLLRMVTASRDQRDCVTKKPAHYTRRNLFSPCHMMAQSYPILCNMMARASLPCLSTNIWLIVSITSTAHIMEQCVGRAAECLSPDDVIGVPQKILLLPLGHVVNHTHASHEVDHFP